MFKKDLMHPHIMIQRNLTLLKTMEEKASLENGLFVFLKSNFQRARQRMRLKFTISLELLKAGGRSAYIKYAEEINDHDAQPERLTQLFDRNKIKK